MKPIIVILPLMFLISCTQTSEMLRPEGTIVTLHLHDGESLTYEILEVRDSSLLCRGEGVVDVPFSRIASLQLPRDRSSSWALPVIFFQGVPSAIALAHEWPYGVLGIAVTVVTWICFDATDTRLVYDQPWSPGDIETIRYHSRYPFGISEEQRESLRAPPPDPVP